jgi:hypothetical protein
MTHRQTVHRNPWFEVTLNDSATAIALAPYWNATGRRD